MSELFTDSGRLKIPGQEEHLQTTEENRKQLTINGAWCSAGHYLLDEEHPVHNLPGLKLGFIRPNGEYGEFVVSSMLNDTAKIAISGEIVNGEKVQLVCPECREPFPLLALCDRCNTGEMVLIYCNQNLDVYDSVSFCNLFGCPNAMLIQSDKVVRAIERDSL